MLKNFGCFTCAWLFLLGYGYVHFNLSVGVLGLGVMGRPAYEYFVPQSVCSACVWGWETCQPAYIHAQQLSLQADYY